MSSAEANRVITMHLHRLLEQSPAYKALKDNTIREALNSKYHIIDMSKVSLYGNIDNDTSRTSKAYDISYPILIKTIIKSIPPDRVYSSISKLNEYSIEGSTLKTPCWISSPPLLITKSFRDTRNFLTDKVSKKIPDDVFFGTTIRNVGLLEQAEIEGLDSTNSIRNVAELRRLFRGRVGKHKKVYSQVISSNEGREDYLRIKSVKSNVSELSETSSIDIGHTRETPLGIKLENAIIGESIKQDVDSDTFEILTDEQVTDRFMYNSCSPIIQDALDKALIALTDIQAKCTYTFKNNLPENTKLFGEAGYLVLSLHFYRRNGAYAKVEGRIYNKIVADIKEALIAQIRILYQIPGSNTIEQDAVQLIKNEIISAIKSSKAAPLLKHSVSKGIVPFESILSNNKIKTKGLDSNQKLGLSLGKRKIHATNVSKLPKIRNLQGQFYSLTSLQTLLNTHLQDVVSANMGNEGYVGGQRRILNYRTGRFAESVKVERLSQSRAGAITAFYTYMRNPYEVFEGGHRMGIPLTRDPKLLISKSIREIAATKVANTMRSVRV